MNAFPWLTVIAGLPLLGAVVLALLPRTAQRLGKQLALAVSIVTFVLAAIVGLRYESGGGLQFVEDATWIKSFGVHYALGVDGIGLVLVLMTTVLVPVLIGAGWHDAEDSGRSAKAYFALMLTVEGLAVGVFAATDLFLFYVLFEATLIPLYFLIGSFGGANRRAASVKFLVYSLVGGLVLLAGVVGVYVESAKAGQPSMLLSDLSRLTISSDNQRWLFVAFFVAFAIKAPMFPVHTWLPDSAAAGTPATSVLLVSVLDKIGTFGMIRYCLRLFPDASRWATPVVLVLALISIFYGALAAIASREMLRLIAYTSVSHFGIMVLGIFALTNTGGSGSTLYMVNHGLATAMLFLVAGYLIRRRGSDLIGAYGGVDNVAPVLSGVFLFAILAGLSLPSLAPFVSEFLALSGTFQRHPWAGVIGTVSIVLAALYMLIMYQRTMTGPTSEQVRGMADINSREKFAVVPLIAMIVVLGFFPKPLLDVIKPAVSDTLTRVGVTDPAPKIPSALEGP